MPRYAGPFKVVDRIGETAYRLELPESWRVHDVFHVSLLKPYRSDGTVPTPAPIDVDDDGTPLWSVNEILDAQAVRARTGRVMARKVLVSWVGFGPEHNCWLPISYLSPDLRKAVLEDPRWDLGVVR